MTLFFKAVIFQLLLYFFSFEQMDNPEPTFGLLVTTVEGAEKRLSFRSGDVITKATMMVGDKVQFNISTNSVTKEECAVNVEILPETFLTDSEEQRKIVSVFQLWSSMVIWNLGNCLEVAIAVVVD